MQRDRLENFREIYGPDGDWVRLFRKSPGFLRTELLADADRSDRFVTVDYWRSREDRDRFREDFEVEFAVLDQSCESMTSDERFIGDFKIVAAG